MWGSQGWNQWALQPAMFNDVPHEQIDWAELAKQWIQMQQTQPAESSPLAPAPLPPAPPPLPPPGHMTLMSKDFPEKNTAPPLLKTPVPRPVAPEPFHANSPFENEQVSFVPPPSDNSSFWNKAQWEESVPNDVDERLWAPTPVEPLLPGKETFDYGHVHDNPPLAMQSIDYNHMSEYSYTQIYPTPAPAPEAPYDQYWSQVNATPTIFLKKERPPTNLPVEEETTQLDAAKRKQLPAWIRDGLEKMEQERLKRLEKERAAKEKMAKTDFFKNKEGSSNTPASIKSKFDSDSELEEMVTNENKRSSPVLKRAPSPTEDMRTEEERTEDLMLKVRRTLTEVLLSVTNTEMVDIAQEMYRKAVSKAPARQLASASSASSVAAGLRGLASYGSGSEASDQEEEGSDSEEELYRRMKEKKRLFAQKEKRIIAELDRKELEEKMEAEREKINADKNGEKKPSKVFHTSDKRDASSDSIVDKNDGSNAHIQTAEHNSPVETPVLSVKADVMEENSKPNKITEEVVENAPPEKKESDSSDSEESSSSDSSESGEKNKKKHKEVKKSKKSKRDKSSSKHSRRSKSRDSESSEKHQRERSREKKNSSSKKKKKYKRSESSGSSSGSLHRRKRSSRYESGHRERRSRSYNHKERRRQRSVSRSKSDRRSSHSRRYSGDKSVRKYKDGKKSPSPSSRLPRKYRSRSLSSESRRSGKKLKKYRNR